jgi:hypothetical protein
MNEAAPTNVAGQVNKAGQISRAAQELQQWPAGCGKNLVPGCHPGSPRFAGAASSHFSSSGDETAAWSLNSDELFKPQEFLSYLQGLSASFDAFSRSP